MGTLEKILIVEPDRDVLMQIKTAVAGHFDATFRSTVAETIDGLLCDVWQAIVYDIGKPGVESLRNVKGLQRLFGADTPLIIIADENSLEIERTIAGCGVFYYLLRPFPARDLVTLLRAAVEIWNKRFGTWMRQGCSHGRGADKREEALAQENRQ